MPHHVATQESGGFALWSCPQLTRNRNIPAALVMTRQSSHCSYGTSLNGPAAHPFETLKDQSILPIWKPSCEQAQNMAQAPSTEEFLSTSSRLIKTPVLRMAAQLWRLFAVCIHTQEWLTDGWSAQILPRSAVITTQSSLLLHNHFCTLFYNSLLKFWCLESYKANTQTVK